MPNALLLELNEVNFDAVRDYVDAGNLPEFERLLACGVIETTSESSYEHLEPWIQWVTAHTGLTFEQHGVFRLGDIVNYDINQIWEDLESRGIKVGAVSPMNGKNRTNDAAFFVPDPWTKTRITGSGIVKRLYGSISQAVSDNAQSKLGIGSLFWLVIGAAWFARFRNYGVYLKFALLARKRPWFKALFLDLLLADLFIKLNKRHQPGFSSLFLNAGAHIQHHYMFSSAAYTGQQKNPKWYVSKDDDPVRDVYKLYDRIVGQIQNEFPDYSFMIATGLHQDPHEKTTFYWRLKDHREFLQQHGIPFESVEPRMSRDFLVRCGTKDRSQRAQEILMSLSDKQGESLFEVDNRGEDLFVMLVYPKEITNHFEIYSNGKNLGRFYDSVAFVAIKNGQHNGIGYFVDCDNALVDPPTGQFALKELPKLIRSVVLRETV